MKVEMQEYKIVVLSGAGISAESGLATFRDSGWLARARGFAQCDPRAWAIDLGRGYVGTASALPDQ